MLHRRSASKGVDKDGRVVLLCGASHMGKSYITTSILATEYNAVYRIIDKVYSIAVADAGLVTAVGSSEKTKEDPIRIARRRARDRKWPNAKAREDFFASYEREIREAARAANSSNVPLVLEGGTLRLEEEVSLIAGAIESEFDAHPRLLRITVEALYERWLQNRVHRMLKSGAVRVELAALSPVRHAKEIARAKAKPSVFFPDVTINSADDVRPIMDKLQAATSDVAFRSLFGIPIQSEFRA